MFLTFIIFICVGIDTMTQTEIPTLHPVLPLGPPPPSPVPLPGGGGTRIHPLVRAPGVAPDQGLGLLKDKHSGRETGGYTGTVHESLI